MLISCPNCATIFSVPDTALGSKGRKVRCSRCGHKWFNESAHAADDFGLDESSFPPPPEPAYADPTPEPEPDYARAPAMTRDFEPEPEPDLDQHDHELELTLENPPVPDFGINRNRPDDLPNLDLDADPEPIPEVFATPEKTKKGTGALWALLVVLLLAVGGVATYHFQDKVVDVFPPANGVLTSLGLRTERPGAGLELKNAGTPERLVQNDSEILIVRGIIANVSDRERPVPTMKLVLLDKNRAVVQEKQSQPPVTALDPGGTAGFRIILERPDPSAVEVNVLFVDSRTGK